MSRRFNFTKRTKISSEDVTITLEPKDNQLFCDVRLKLGNYKLKAGAQVIVEAQRGRVLRIRHNWGLAGRAFSQEGASTKFDITSMGDPEDVQYRVLVVEQSTCCLLATAEGIKADDPLTGQSSKSSLLPVVIRELHGGVWELENLEETPTLVLDSSLGTKRELQSSPILLVILIGAIRAILTHLAHDQQGLAKDDDGDTAGSSVSGKWLEQGEKWAGLPYPSSTDHKEIDAWAQNAVSGFCLEKNMCSILASTIDMTQGE